MPDVEPPKKQESYVSPDISAIGSLFFMIFAGLYVTCGLSWAKARGDARLFHLAVFLGVVGSAMLLVARIPLYRQRRFFSVGPGSLSGVYRKLYFAAYAFILPSVLLLVLLLLTLR